MKNVSLFKVSALVITIAFASSFVKAEDKITEKAQSTLTKPAKLSSFSGLIAAFDQDKNGILSQNEAAADQNHLLNVEFNKIDANQDKQIDEAEFNNYLEEVNGKITDLAKSTG
ncbi:hypothetical protein NBRC116592_32450 [Colwellia sp. KU-HH00111]|uniref:hypothetical protein n=1 Tax=Colwellia sp. KU-HH00111 TaxID=3127652 RepID=UPI0031066652